MLFHRFVSGDRGQALLETALAVPFLLLLIVGLIEVGRFAHDSIAIGNAARAGAEYGIINPSNAASTSGMVTAATNDVGTLLSPVPTVSAALVCVCSNGTASANCLASDCTTPYPNHLVKYATVTVSGTYHALFHYPGVPSNVPISKTASLQTPQW